MTLIQERVSAARRAISVITLGEIRFGALKAAWGTRRAAAMEEELGKYAVLILDSAVAEVWARLRAAGHRAGRQIGENDLWIAATAKRYEIPLATLDHAQYGIPGLTVITEEGTEVSLPE